MSVDWLTGEELEKVKSVDMSTLEPIEGSVYGKQLHYESLAELEKGRKQVNSHKDGEIASFDLTTRVEMCLMTLDAMESDFPFDYSFAWDHSPVTKIYIKPDEDATRDDVEVFIEKFEGVTEYGQFVGRGSIEKCDNPDAPGNEWDDECWTVEVVQV